MSSIEMYAITDVGIKRNHNEDCVGTTPQLGFAVLADGMGGHNAGEVASAMAVDVVSRNLQGRLPKMGVAQLDEDTGFSGESILTRDSVAMANEVIFETAQQKRECAGMGTTIVVAVFYADRVTAAHVGDSRMYRLRGDKLSHVTDSIRTQNNNYDAHQEFYLIFHGFSSKYCFWFL